MEHPASQESVLQAGEVKQNCAESMGSRLVIFEISLKIWFKWHITLYYYIIHIWWLSHYHIWNQLKNLIQIICNTIIFKLSSKFDQNNIIYIIFRLRFKKLGMEGMTRNPRTFRNGPGHSGCLGSRWLSVKFWECPCSNTASHWCSTSMTWSPHLRSSYSTGPYRRSRGKGSGGGYACRSRGHRCFLCCCWGPALLIHVDLLLYLLTTLSKDFRGTSNIKGKKITSTLCTKVALQQEYDDEIRMLNLDDIPEIDMGGPRKGPGKGCG